MIFSQKLLAPGPGTQLRATFRWRPIQSALSGSLFFKPPALPEVMTCGNPMYHEAPIEKEERWELYFLQILNRIKKASLESTKGEILWEPWNFFAPR